MGLSHYMGECVNDKYVLKIIHADGYERVLSTSTGKLKTAKEMAMRIYSQMREEEPEHSFKLLTMRLAIVHDGVLAAEWKPPLVMGRMFWVNHNGYFDRRKPGKQEEPVTGKKPEFEFPKRTSRIKADSYNAQMVEVLQECMRHARAMGLDQNRVFWAWDDFYNKSLVLNFNHSVDSLTTKLHNHKIPGVDYMVARNEVNDVALFERFKNGVSDLVS